MSKYVYDKNSFDNALEVSNYPWGFRLKTKRRTWIETDKNKGDRVCFCTLNPKTNKWCAVKKRCVRYLLHRSESVANAGCHIC